MTSPPNATAQRCSNVDASRNGEVFDSQAVNALWQQHRRWIAAVLLTYKPHSEDLDDLLQEVAMTLVSKVNTVRDESNIRAWLRAVAVNTARAAGRRQRSRPELHLAGADVDELVRARRETSAVEIDDHSQRVLRLASQLPEAYREPLMLKAVQGMRTRQISEILGIPEATVDTRVSRARRMLREQAALEMTKGRCAAPAESISLNGHSHTSGQGVHHD